jgi:aminoglycoside/choline kinase family phosphotransferase
MNNIQLTPAQIDFLNRSLKDFSPDSWNIEIAGRAASTRYFVRLARGNQSYVLVAWDGHDEDWDRFLTIQRELCPIVPFLPKIYNEDKILGLILEEDLGTVTLKQFCNQNSTNLSIVMDVYKKVLDSVGKWHNIRTDASVIISSRAMDLDVFMWETAYFAHFCVTDFCGCSHLLDSRWERERLALANEAASLPKACVHRDFQSENVMMFKNEIRFVDYQGSRLGPAEYDIASLLFDPYIKLLDEKAINTLYVYYSELYNVKTVSRAFYICAAQRLMQALGAYGNLSLHKGKEWYRDYIPVALARLHLVLEYLPEFTSIRNVVSSCKESLKI